MSPPNETTAPGEPAGGLAWDAGPVREWLGCARLRVTGSPRGAGWSGCTLFVTADRRELVVRLAPVGRGMFAEHDLGLQVRCLRHAGGHGLPAPEVVAADLTGATLGRPGYAMVRVPGRVPSDDRPAFTRAGFLFDASPDQQRRYSEDLVDRIAQLHRVPPPDGLALGPALTGHLAWCRDQDDHSPAVLRRAHRLLADTAPPDDPAPALVWGDARPANTIVDDRFRVAALLDWELAATGPPELDVAWLLEMNRMRAGTDPPLPGFLPEEQVWSRWAAATGRTPRAREWFRRFAAYRVAVLMRLHLAERVRAGALPADHPVHTDNRALRRLAELLA